MGIGKDLYILFAPQFFGLPVVDSYETDQTAAGQLIANDHGLMYLCGSFAKQAVHVEKVASLLPFSAIREIARAHLALRSCHSQSGLPSPSLCV